jgi:hypothetical protein
VQRALQALVGAHDADVVPHEAAQFVPVVGDDDLLVGVATWLSSQAAARAGTAVAPPGCPRRSRRAQHHAFQQRVAGQAVGAVQAGVGGFAHRVEARQVGAAVQVGDHAAAGVVRRRHHRNRLRVMSMPSCRQRAWMVGKWSFRRNSAELVRHVQEHAVEAVLLHLEVDGAGHDVARRQFGARVVGRHEARAVGQAQVPALAAQRLGDQEGLGVRVVEAGRVELDELHVATRQPARQAMAMPSPVAALPSHRFPVNPWFPGKSIGQCLLFFSNLHLILGYNAPLKAWRNRAAGSWLMAFNCASTA